MPLFIDLIRERLSLSCLMSKSPGFGSFCFFPGAQSASVAALTNLNDNGSYLDLQQCPGTQLPVDRLFLLASAENLGPWGPASLQVWPESLSPAAYGAALARPRG